MAKLYCRTCEQELNSDTCKDHRMQRHDVVAVFRDENGERASSESCLLCGKQLTAHELANYDKFRGQCADCADPGWSDY